MIVGRYDKKLCQVQICTRSCAHFGSRCAASLAGGHIGIVGAAICCVSVARPLCWCSLCSCSSCWCVRYTGAVVVVLVFVVAQVGGSRVRRVCTGICRVGVGFVVRVWC
jgi:hypothetical protein